MQITAFPRKPTAFHSSTFCFFCSLTPTLMNASFFTFPSAKTHLRRPLNLAGLAAGLLLATTGRAQEQAKPADSFVETVAIGGRMDVASEKGHFSAVSAAIRDIGFRYQRVGSLPESGSIDQFYQNLRDNADQGKIKYCAVVDRFTTREALENFLTAMSSRVYALEGENERFK